MISVVACADETFIVAKSPCDVITKGKEEPFGRNNLTGGLAEIHCLHTLGAQQLHLYGNEHSKVQRRQA